MEIKRVLIHDERNSCMKLDLHITLNSDAVEYNDKSKSESKKVALRKVFRARLAEFVKAHLRFQMIHFQCYTIERNQMKIQRLRLRVLVLLWKRWLLFQRLNCFHLSSKSHQLQSVHHQVGLHQLRLGMLFQ